MSKGVRLRNQRRIEREALAKKKKHPRREQLKKPTGISTNWYYIIKYIAIVTMVCDHLGIVLFTLGWISLEAVLYLRIIGRFAFPLFAFELVECFYHTKNRKKHLLELGGLALISEFPFDMALIAKNIHYFRYGDIVDYSCLSSQNVCYTLFFAFLMLMWRDKLNVQALEKYYRSYKVRKFVSRFGKPMVLFLFMVVCELIHTDYASLGILFVGLLDFAKNRKHMRFWQGLAVIAFVFGTGRSILLNIPVVLVLIIIFMSERQPKQGSDSTKENGLVKRLGILTNSKSRLICRWFYPAHLFLLTVIRFVFS